MPEPGTDTVHFELPDEVGEDAVRAYRTSLQKGRRILRERFEGGVPASALVRQHAHLVDELLIHACERFVQIDPGDEESCALVAVGGYGRAELHPHSDVDIMILLPGTQHGPYDQRIEQFITFLWDIGLDVGHSARTIQECLEQATGDITVTTNMLEARLLAGPQALFDQLQEAVGPQHIWPSREFFTAKWQEQIRRHDKFHDIAYNLEPNIKQGPGGLRDIQMIGWIARRHFGVDNLHELVERGFLTDEEYRSLTHNREFLWQIRAMLHYLTGRHEDRLLFDHQPGLAEALGYRDTEHQLGVEQFMKRYYRTIGELDRLNEMLLQLFQEAILYADDSGEPVPINNRFQARRGFLEIVHRGIFKRYPFAILEVFLVMAENPQLKGLRAQTIRLIRSHLYLIDDQFRNDLRCRSLFIEILRQPQGITRELRRMHRYGVLGAYLPAFGNIIGQMQYDLFHVYSVDEHTLFVVRNLRRFATAEHAHEFPQCSAIMRRLAKPELLYLAGLFHDIAKGRGGDHSELGADDAIDFCLHHGLSQHDANLVSWLVADHLKMSLTAQRKDISDPTVISAFAGEVGNQSRLDYLYLLTVADICATNPELWNSWKGALLAELYAATQRALRRGLGTTFDEDETILNMREQARRQLREQGLDDGRIGALWRDLPDEYFLRYPITDVRLHSTAILDSDASDLPLVLVYEPADLGGTAVFIYTRAEPHRFAVATATLDQLGLTIADARIINSHTGYTLDTYVVLEPSGEPAADPDRKEEICTTLREHIRAPQLATREIRRRMPRQHKHFPIATKVMFARDDKNSRTVMEVTTADRPGLLARIGRVLEELGVHLQNAKITTLGARAEDIFFVTDAGHEALDEAAQTRLREALLEKLAGE